MGAEQQDCARLAGVAQRFGYLLPLSALRPSVARHLHHHRQRHGQEHRGCRQPERSWARRGQAAGESDQQRDERADHVARVQVVGAGDGQQHRNEHREQSQPAGEHRAAPLGPVRSQHQQRAAGARGQRGDRDR